MKKRLLVLGMIACLFGLTACGNNESAQVLTEEEEAAAQVADSYISQIAQIEADGTADQYIAYDESLEGVFSSWERGMEDLGGYVETTGHDVDLSDNKEVVVNVDITGSALDPKGQPRTATVEVIYTAKDYKLSSLSVNVNYTFGELMKNAALNTVLGMGTVFVILILISLIISCFSLIPKIEAAFKKKEPAKEEKKDVVDQIIEKEELADDSELVAVISAAIAAYEADNGSASSDGFVVRSIRKVNKSKWQNA